ncbi:trk system potassium uptake protein TrkA [Hydrogenispora ethanolica]|uniref:Trk system potassium uptake protein TrkA n=1 Tax=Hydrogenispora ethanolica TaxID=1082276 RepID=A0A4R1S2Q3_HYDET|nr:TrkA family potassium uptake protein [Hydrogenispora ethanolica]TCL73319.1 trk system potassium uptake protein TrkA [Hydrogenispora ethanolica]
MIKQYAVIGLGRFGTSVARTLFRLGQEVLAIDTSEERVKYIADEVTHSLVADTTDANVLKNIGIANFDVVIVAIGENVQANIMTTLLLKELGVKYVLVKALNKMQGRVLEKIGADRVVYPERDMGKRVAHNLVAPNMVDYIELAQGFRISEFMAYKDMFGKSLRTLNLRFKYNLNVLLIKRAGGELISSPGPDDIIQMGDMLVLAGEKEALDNFERHQDQLKKQIK